MFLPEVIVLLQHVFMDCLDWIDNSRGRGSRDDQEEDLHSESFFGEGYQNGPSFRNDLDKAGICVRLNSFTRRALPVHLENIFQNSLKISPDSP